MRYGMIGLERVDGCDVAHLPDGYCVRRPGHDMQAHFRRRSEALEYIRRGRWMDRYLASRERERLVHQVLGLD